MNFFVGIIFYLNKMEVFMFIVIYVVLFMCVSSIIYYVDVGIKGRDLNIG